MQECQLSAGDVIALYTDGLTESFNDSEQEFGECRLVESLRCCREQPLSEMVNSIVGDVRKFSPREQSDDITLIVAKCR
jgi:serine phosphatase RsbU (regulator of sigma subunit)